MWSKQKNELMNEWSKKGLQKKPSESNNEDKKKSLKALSMM
jgi:hypothetical protein